VSVYHKGFTKLDYEVAYGDKFLALLIHPWLYLLSDTAWKTGVTALLFHIALWQFYP